MLRIAGVVVLYNPDDKVLVNIPTYLDDVDVLYVVDNSDTPNNGLVEQLRRIPKVGYYSEARNLGIAKAFNIAAHKAAAAGYDWLLTMDQDSRASEDMLNRMISLIEDNDMDDVVIVSPRHATLGYENNLYGEMVLKLGVMSSGNLLNLRVYQQLGDFMEELFIDYVDYEYCLRANSKGYKVLQINDAVLYHELGRQKMHKLLWKEVSVTHHNAVRRYYITRNRLFVSAKYKRAYPEFYRREMRSFLAETLKIILFEDNKFGKLKSTVKGLRDYGRGCLGMARADLTL